MGGGLIKLLKRTLKSITPQRNRATGGHFITVAQGIGITATQLPPDTGTATIGKWGDLQEILAATANLTDCWLESLVISQCTTTASESLIGITTEAGTNALTYALAEAVVGLFAPLNTGQPVVIPLKPPLHIEAGQRIAAAIAGVKKVDCYVIISRNK